MLMLNFETKKHLFLNNKKDKAPNTSAVWPAVSPNCWCLPGGLNGFSLVFLQFLVQKRGGTCLSKKMHWVCFWATWQETGNQCALWANTMDMHLELKIQWKQTWNLEPWFGCRASQHIRHSLAEHRGLIPLQINFKNLWLATVLVILPQRHLAASMLRTITALQSPEPSSTDFKHKYLAHING